MPEQPDYIQGAYKLLKLQHKDAFTVSEEDFRKGVSTDQAYASTIFKNLKESYGDDFEYDENDFYNAVGLKKKGQSESGGTPSQSNGKTLPGLTQSVPTDPLAGIGSQNKAKAVPQKQVAVKSTQPAIPTKEEMSQATPVGEGLGVSLEVTDELPKVEDVSTGEGFVNAVKKGLGEGEIAEIINSGRALTKEDFRRIAQLKREQQALPDSDVYKEYANEGDISKRMNLLAKDPMGILLPLVTQSMTSMLRSGYTYMAGGATAGAAVGSVVPVGGTVAGGVTGGIAGFMSGMVAAGANQEIAASFLESLQEAGIDVTDEKSLIEGFADEKKMAAAREYALKRAIPITLFNILGGALGGKIWSFGKGVVAKPLAKGAIRAGLGTAELGLQSGIEGTGEGVAQWVSTGKLKPTEIMDEIVGGWASESPNVVLGTLLEKSKSGENILPDLIKAKISTQDFNEMVDISEGAGEITPEQADGIKAQNEVVQAAKEKIPDGLKENETAVLGVIAKDALDRQIAELQASKEGIDPMFHGKVDEQIATLESQKVELQKEVETEINKPQTNDTENIEGLPSEVGIGQEPIQAEPIQETGTEAVETGGVLQTPIQEEIVAEPVKPAVVMTDETPKYYSYHYTKEKGKHFVEQPNAKPVNLDVAGDFFVHKEPKTNLWVVSEASTGMKISDAKTQKVAISDANTKVKSGRYKEALKAAQNNQLSPRYKEEWVKNSRQLQEEKETEFAALSEKENEISAAETKKINEEFAARQAELDKYIPESELEENRISDKIDALLDDANNGRKLDKDEVDFLNENSFKPKGFSFNEEGSLVKPAKPKAEPKTEVSQQEPPATGSSTGAVENVPEKPKSFKEVAKLSHKDLIAEARKQIQELKEGRGNVGIQDDQAKREGKILALYTLMAESYIKEGIKTVADFAKAIGEEVSEVIQKAWDAAIATEPPKETTRKEPEDEQPKKEKVLFGRAYRGTTSEKVQEALSKHGLTRDVQSQTEAYAVSDEIIADIGLENAYVAVKEHKINGAPAAIIMGKMVDHAKSMVEADMSAEDIQNFIDIQAEIIRVFEERSVEIGQFSNALQWVYMNSDYQWDFDAMMSDFKKSVGNREISPEQEAKIKQQSEEIAALKEKYDKLLEQQKKEQEQYDVDAITESVSKETKRKKTALNPKEQAEIKRLYNKFGVLNDITRMATLIADPDFRKLTKLVLKEAAGDFKIFANELLTKFGIHIKGFLPELYDKAGGKGEIDMEGLHGLPSIKKGKLSVPNAIIREFVRDGITDVDKLVEAVKVVVADILPDVTDRQVRDAISKYGRSLNINKGDIETEIRRMSRVMRLTSKLEDLRKGKRPDKRGKDTVSDEEKRLIKEIKKESQNLPVNVEESLATLKESANRRLEEYKRRLKDKEFTPESKAHKPTDAELRNIETEIRRIKNDFLTEKYKEEIKNRTADQKFWAGVGETWNLPRILMTTFELSFTWIQMGAYTSKFLLTRPKLFAEAVVEMVRNMGSARYNEKFVAKIESDPDFELMHDSDLSLTKLDPRLKAREEMGMSNWMNYVWNAVGSPLLLFDFLTVQATKRITGKSLFSRWSTANIPLALERGNIGYSNTLRVARFMDGKRALESQGILYKDDPKAYKNMADAVNTVSLRSSLHFAKNIERGASYLLFSPKAWASTLKMASPIGLYWSGITLRDSSSKGQKSGMTVAQKMFLADYLTMTGITASVMLAYAAYYDNDDDKETEVIQDPTSTYFMCVRKGDSFLDPWRGMRPLIVLQARIVAGAYTLASGKKAGVRQEVGVGRYSKTSASMIGDYAKNKLSPSASFWLKALGSHKEEQDGKMVRVDPYGNKLMSRESLENIVVPMYINSMAELRKEQPATTQIFWGSLGFIGMSIQTNKPKANSTPSGKGSSGKDSDGGKGSSVQD